MVERYYLVLWEEEKCVSVHSDGELREPGVEERVVGSMCTLFFGKNLCTGKIACCGMFYLFATLMLMRIS